MCIAFIAVLRSLTPRSVPTPAPATDIDAFFNSQSPRLHPTHMSTECPVSSPTMTITKRAERPAEVRRVSRALKFRSPGDGKLKDRKSRILYHYTKEELAPYFHISQREAAKCLGVAVITLKRICKRGNFNWPYRANKTKIAQDRVKAEKEKVLSKNVGQVSACRPTARWPERPTGGPSGSLGQTPDVVVEDQARQALSSLALCAMHVEHQHPHTPQMKFMSPAAIAFSLLPYLCMSENLE